MSATLPQPPGTVATFAQLLSSTRRGARLARLLATTQLRAWDLSPDVTERAEQTVAELATNAALHGRVQGRDTRLALTLDATTGLLRIAVTDAEGGQLPVVPTDSPTDRETGRGLLMVGALADRWGTEPHPPGGKTVWATLSASSTTATRDAPPRG
ncbi:ATP-binding protein [Streptomyces gilvifuscus]|uniref:ATP-binding protein n=1 Tax=Streptomyces gilvifuscus TaxID=1550617 RepID=A0ABT5FKI7_9ACTN|nr:ATP-binding protein [Streptomyces gilvifuscus]MDC2953017.1 ATP-binding protein [Streptomyces gilvifuscus]